jgi:starvation-inducible DNA-binding protein
MNELQASLKIALANAFKMYFAAQQAHWNVEGPYFSQYHDFFGDIYTDVQSSIDDIAERIRITGAYAPSSLPMLLASSTIEDMPPAPASCRTLLIGLIAANQQMIASLNKAFEYAELARDQGLMDYLAGRLDVHKKHGWMLDASSKTLGEY